VVQFVKIDGKNPKKNFVKKYIATLHDNSIYHLRARQVWVPNRYMVGIGYTYDIR